jgi:plastocyanin
MLAALLALPGCATTGAIHGKLHLAPRGKSPATSRVVRGGPRSDTITNAVVYVDKLPSNRPAPRAAKPRLPVTVLQRNHRFVPHVLPVVAGTTVRFENRDRIYHNVFSISRAKHFEAGGCPPRHSRKVTFDKPGEVRLFCEVDPKMGGFVFVVPNDVYTQPDSTGAFSLRGLPRGKYRIRVWHPTRGRVSRNVDIRSRDAAISLRI